MDSDDEDIQGSSDDQSSVLAPGPGYLPSDADEDAELLLQDDGIAEEPETDEADEEPGASTSPEEVGRRMPNDIEIILRILERARGEQRTVPMVIEGEENNSQSVTIQYDTNLPAEHSYLGGNMNRVSGVEYLETDREHRIMLFMYGNLIYPGEVVPFMIPRLIIESGMGYDANNGLLFGLAFPHVLCPKTGAMYGVTCQIYEMGVDERGNTLIKSRALQRCIVSKETRAEDLELLTDNPQMKVFGNVRVLPEIYLNEPLSCINLGSMNRFRDTYAGDLLRTFQASTTAWPSFVYKQYSVDTIIENVVKSLMSFKIESMPKDPIRLSFWLANNCQFSEHTLKRLFMTDSVNLRLRIIAESHEHGGVFSCKFCRSAIAYCRDLFAMSKHGVQSHYCNSAGYIHETNTVYRVISNSVVLTGQSSTQFSWFPGYEWHVIVCRRCNRHIGWQFRACENDLIPTRFYGISGSSVRIEKARITNDLEYLVASQGLLHTM